MSDDNVIHAFGKSGDLPELTFDIERRLHDYCQHHQVTLDQHERSIRCRKCGAVLDAFNFIRDQAIVIARAWTDHQYVARQVNDLRESVVQLKREEKRLKDSIRRTKEKVPPALTVGRPL